MMKNLRIVLKLIKIKIMKQMMYREMFIGGIWVNLSLLIVQLIFFRVLYSNFQNIGDWNKYEMIFFMGTYMLISNIGVMLFYLGLNSIPAFVRSGRLDYYITKPCNPVVFIGFCGFDFSSVPMVLISTLIIIYAAIMSNIDFNMTRILAYIITIIIMEILYFELIFIIRCFAFFFIDISGLLNFEWTLNELTMKIPGNLFTGWLKIFLCTIIPYGIIATVPSEAFFNKFDFNKAVYILVITLVFSILSYLIWKIALRHYSSSNG